MRERNGSPLRSSCKRTRIATGACLRDEYSKQNRRAHGMSRDAKRNRDAQRPTTSKVLPSSPPTARRRAKPPSLPPVAKRGNRTMTRHA